MSQATSSKLDKSFGLALCGVEVDSGAAHCGARVHRRKLANHCFGRIDARFGFSRARFGTAAEPFDFSANAVAQALLLFALRFEVGLALLEKAAEVALHA